MSQTSCIRSLSDDTMVVVALASQASRAYVAIRSSASKPDCSRQGISKARTASRISGNCGMRSSGGAERLALYSPYMLAAEGFFRLVEDHGQMGWPIVGRHLLQQLPQHIAEAEHGIDLQPVGLAGTAAAARDRRGKYSRTRPPGRDGLPASARAMWQGLSRPVWRRRAGQAPASARAWIWLTAWPECGPSELDESTPQRQGCGLNDRHPRA